MTEFELIARYFDRPARRAALGIGDDCALLALREGHDLAISTDMLVAGRHFLHDADAASLGWKALAVNLSDLAAVGASPLAFTLALALPAIDEDWLSRFSAGLFECAARFDCELIGGDTTRGPLNLCITVFGESIRGTALRRSGARPGDDVWITGEPGRAALALRQMLAGAAVDPASRAALDRPEPRVAFGAALVGVASAVIDVSDGLAQDLGHVLAASGCGAKIDATALPIGDALSALAVDDRERLVLTGGDDYELCFTAPPSNADTILRTARTSGVRATRIGTIVEGAGLTLTGSSLSSVTLQGFDHFA